MKTVVDLDGFSSVALDNSRCDFSWSVLALVVFVTIRGLAGNLPMFLVFETEACLHRFL